MYETLHWKTTLHTVLAYTAIPGSNQVTYKPMP